MPRNDRKRAYILMLRIEIGIVLANWTNTRAADGLALYVAAHLQPGHWLCRKMNPCLPWVRPSTSCAISMPSNDRKRECILMFPDDIPPWQGSIIMCPHYLSTPSLRLIQLCYQLSEPQRLIPVSLLAHYVILYKRPYIHTVWDTLCGDNGHKYAILAWERRPIREL